MSQLHRYLTITMIFATALLVPVAVGQTGQTTAQTTAAIHIVSPKNADKIEANAVIVRYELAVGVSAAGSARFRLQLDAGEPVRASVTEYAFTGLATGAHVVTVAVVDANGTPIYGAQDQVHFSVVPPQSK